MHSPSSSHQKKKPSSKERMKNRIKLAQEYGNGDKKTITREVRTAPSKANGHVRGTRVESYRYGVDILCHMCGDPLQIADSGRDEVRPGVWKVVRPDMAATYVEADRINPGEEYSMPNILPACGACNKLRSDSLLPKAHVERYRAQYGHGGKYFDHRR